MPTTFPDRDGATTTPDCCANYPDRRSLNTPSMVVRLLLNRDG
jgi:hypothetical protein